MTLTLQSVTAWEILDSRGNPTLAVAVRLSDGAAAEAHVPSGASTGSHEARERRDGDPAWYFGRGVRETAARLAAAAPLHAPVQPLASFEQLLDAGSIGANAALALSCAVARALALSRRQPLWRLLADEFASAEPRLPLPMINVLSGGLHAGGQIEFQDFLAVPHGFRTYHEALHAVVRIHHAARELLAGAGFVLTGVADEGGWGPRLSTNAAALDILTKAIERAGYVPGEQVSIAIDAASSHFHNSGVYTLRSEARSLDAAAMSDLFGEWMDRYPVISIEDALAEDDWAGWTRLTDALGRRCQLIGDDLFCTNPERLRRGISESAANSVLVKMNQIGSLSATFDVLRIARQAGFTAVVSARSGETEDPFLADLAIASGAGQIKVGSITRSERLAKYNRLLEAEMRENLPYAGALPLANWLTAGSSQHA